MASVASAPSVIISTEAFTLTKVTITWDNADLTCQDVSHGGPKGIRPAAKWFGYGTTAASNVSQFSIDDSDVTNGEVDIVAQAETGGSVANLVSEHYFLFTAKGDQNAASITP